MTKNRSSLNSKLLKAILIPTGLALALTFAGAAIFGWLNYRNILERTKVELVSKSNLAARRITAELLIGSRGAPESVAQTLKEDLQLEAVELDPIHLVCTPVAGSACLSIGAMSLSATHELSSGSGLRYVKVSQQIPSFVASLPTTYLLWAGLPIFLIIGAGTYLQQRQLRRYVTRPLETIIGKMSKGAEIPQHWPKEFVRLHGDLNDAFQKRDQAIIGQIASGVIHDLKTLLQPISGATQLVTEAQNTENRDSRAELLLKACQRNLPKMQSILESVLDGNREIRLQPRQFSLEETMKSAIRTARESVNVGVHVSIESASDIPTSTMLHDPVQLERALTNLVKNGIESAAHSNGARKVLVRLSSGPKSEPEISIEDSGEGLSAPLETLVAQRTSSKVRGTGLGLLISKKIVEAHGGSLTGSRSDTLSGAKLSITLPVQEGA